MRSKDPRARIDPPFRAVFPGSGWSFTFQVDGEPQRAHWKLSNPDAGVIDHTGSFMAHREYRQAATQILATSEDGKFSATAHVAIQVGPPPGDGPTPVDDFSIHGAFQSVPWNDPHGRRAVLLMIETLEQLPREFRHAVGSVAVVRMKSIGGDAGRFWGIAGMHLPFLTRAVLISDSLMVSQLDPSAGEFTPADRRFVRTFVHELAHVAFANRAIPDLDRLALLTGLHVAVGTAGVTHGTSLLVMAGAALARYYSPFAGRDIVTDYAEVTGWVINNPNPLGFLWNDGTVAPDAVTGLKLLGQFVGLRNPNTPLVPIVFDPDAPTQDEIDNARTPEEIEIVKAKLDEVRTTQDRYFQRKGFASRYAATDVHEDFCEAIVALAFGEPVVRDPAFAARKQFVHNRGFWPRKWDPIVPGAVLDRWAKENGKPLPNVYDWAVHMGPYSGRPRFPDRLTLLPARKPRRSPGAKGAASAMALDGEAAESAPATGEVDSGGWRGGGGEMEYTWGHAEVEQALRVHRHLGKIVAEQDAHAEEIAPALGRAREALGAMEVPLRGGSAIELLRTAECHGEGLVFLGKQGAAESGGAIEVAGRRAAPGDLVVSAGGSVYLVTRADDAGRIIELAGEPEITASGKVRPLVVRGGTLRYYWRPSRERRVWVEPGASAGEYADLSTVLTHMVRLWGTREGRRGSDLSTAGDFVAEVLSSAGIRHRGLAGVDSEAVRDYLDRFGQGVWAGGGKEPAAWPAVGDLVRFRRERVWGICTRAGGPGGALDALVQGGLSGHAGEEEETITLQHAVDPSRLSAVWRPSSERRKGT